jgi:hypothetical protein
VRSISRGMKHFRPNSKKRAMRALHVVSEKLYVFEIGCS